jgi:TolB protein
MVAPQAVPRRALALPEENAHTPLKRTRYLRHMRGVALAIVIVVASLAAGAAASAPPGGGGRIVFASDRAPDLGRTMFTSVDSRDARRRSVLGFAPQGSALAPDGQRYAAVSFVRGEGGRLLVGRLGSGARPVATSPYEITEPVWSPEGRRIAYEVVNPTSCGPGDHACATYELWVSAAAGGPSRRIASAARFPVWSPNGRLIAFAWHFDTYGGTGVPAVVSASGGSPHRLARTRTEGGIALAPEGRRIAFPTERGAVAIAPLRGATARSVTQGRAVTWASSKTLVVARPRTGLAVARPDGRVLKRIRTPGGPVDAASRSSGAAEVAYLERNGAKQPPSWIVAVVGLRDGRTRELLRVDRFATVTPPVWSRAGSRVVVATTRTDNDSELYTMRADGSDIGRLTNDDVYDLDPAVSPDGRRIVFRGGTGSGLFVIGSRGGGRTRLTTPPPGSEDLYPSWSRDGERVAFVRSLTPSGLTAAELWTIRADGTDARRLYVSDHDLVGTTWSSRDESIAFGRFDLSRPAIWTVGPDGREAHELTTLGGVTAPAWSLRGHRLAFVTAGTTNLVVLDVESGAATVAATDAEWGSRPAWSPDDSQIAFLAADRHVHSVSLAEGDEAELTPGPAREWGLDWSRSSG